MATILFYSSFNGRSRDTESLMLAFRSQGHKVISLSQAEGKFIHDFLRASGVETKSVRISNRFPLVFYFVHCLYFVWFCWRKNVDIVYSHLEPPNIVSVFGQFFVRSKVYICRHHQDLFFHLSKRRIVDNVINRLARKIIVVAEATKKFMVEHEGARSEKIIVIPLAYDFQLYPMPNEEKVRKLRDDIGSQLLLISVGRFTKTKRFELSIMVLAELLKREVDVALVLVGAGPEEEGYRSLSLQLGVGKKVIFTGFVQNVLDYIALSDILIHPSLSESSCVVVKEAGFLRKPVVVGSGVGDFSDYINETNGIIVDCNDFVNGSVKELMDCFKNREVLKEKGDLLHQAVLARFHINNVLPKYASCNGAS